MVVDEIHVVVVRASSFKDRNHNARPVSGCSARGNVPCKIAVDVVVTVLHVVPLLTHLRIVGQRFAVLNRVVELSRFDASVLAKRAKHGPVLGRSRSAFRTEQVDVRTRRQCLDMLQAVFGCPFGTVLVVVKHDDELAGKVALCDGCRAHSQQRDCEEHLEGVDQFHEKF